MEKTNKYYGIIENLVRQHKKFPGLEEILDEIIDDVYSHSEVIINSINNDSVINAYLAKVISTSIITVPKKLKFKSASCTGNEKSVNTELLDKMINSAHSSEITLQAVDTNDKEESLKELENNIDTVVEEQADLSEPAEELVFSDDKEQVVSGLDNTESLSQSLNADNDVLEPESPDVMEPIDAQENELLENTVGPITEELVSDYEDFVSVEDNDNQQENDDIEELFTEEFDNSENDENFGNSESVAQEEAEMLTFADSEDGAQAEAEIGQETADDITGNEDNLQQSVDEDFIESLTEKEPEFIQSEENEIAESTLPESVEVSDSLEFSDDILQEELNLDDTLELSSDNDSSENILESVVDSDVEMLDFQEETLSEENADEFESLEESAKIEEAGEEQPANNSAIDFSVFSYVPDADNDSIDVDRLTNELAELNNKRSDLNIAKVFELKYKENLSVQEIALQLEMSENSVIEALSEIIALV